MLAPVTPSRSRSRTSQGTAYGGLRAERKTRERRKILVTIKNAETRVNRCCVRPGRSHIVVVGRRLFRTVVASV